MTLTEPNLTGLDITLRSDFDVDLTTRTNTDIDFCRIARVSTKGANQLEQHFKLSFPITHKAFIKHGRVSP